MNEKLRVLRGVKESYAVTLGVVAVVVITLAGADDAGAASGAIGLMVSTLLGGKAVVEREKVKQNGNGEAS